ncbi:tail fiber domain-containing protein [Pantoea sp. BAV 3049]|uniref:tail fiber domain-containing protein n=1 Tax=Pantoea sp. BAV 3049 TaxID=2654188 RepID=UPI00131CA0E4|nr:tail fiber domain-containing protein [Pantoea sp. BAV 3049]
MSAGTLSVTNQSATVTGAGTTFTTELKTGDFIGVIVGGVPYTLVVLNIDSDTSLTIGTAYTGPTSSELAWYAVPATLQVAITQKVLNDVATMTRGMILDKENWQQVFSGTGTITVKLPDGSTYSGPAWNGVAAKGANSDITELKGLTTALSLNQGGTGATSKDGAWANLATYGTTAGTAAQGNDGRLNTVDGKSGGTINGWVYLNNNASSAYSSRSQLLIFDVLTNGASRGNVNLYSNIDSTAARSFKIDVYSDSANGKSFTFLQASGNATASGSWVSGSDERHKSNITLVPDALRAVLSWRGCTYDKLDGVPEVGLIAQDIEKDCPIAVMNGGRREFTNGLVIEDFKNLNTSGAAAAYHTEAIKALFSLVELAIVDPDRALASIDAIKDALAAAEPSS